MQVMFNGISKRTLMNAFVGSICGVFLLSSSLFQYTHAQTYTTDQQHYLDARNALKNNHTKTFNTLRKQLDGYPLTIYLDFHSSMDKILTHTGQQAVSELAQFSDTPLFNTARSRYLMNAGAKKRWNDFLAVSPQRPNSIILQCFYYRAQLSVGDKSTAYKGAQTLWLYGKSRPEECDPLFKVWTKAGLRTQEMIWSRMLLSFNTGQHGLLTYLSRKLTSHKKDAKLLLSVYKDPRSLRHKNKFKGQANIKGEIVAAGLKKLARKDLNYAVKLYMSYQKLDRFSDFQGRKLSRYFVKRAIIRQEVKLKSFVDTMLPLLDSDDLLELRMRWAIREGDFESVTTYLPLLSEQGRNKSRWQYWLSRTSRPSTDESIPAIDDTNNEPLNVTVSSRLDTLSQQRNFYGFTAANELGSAFNLEHADTVSNDVLRPALSEDKGLARVIELIAIDKTIDARAEWVLMLKRHNRDMQKEYATLAVENNWFDLGVQASIQAKQWNDMTLRFPYAANQEFTQASKQHNVDIDELRAIARRESAFYPYATSGVGARGLMQLMPATAKETSNKLGVKYKGKRSLYNVKTNIQLGSAYYASLLKQFNNNRVLATAAYNAGPHRVKRWLKATKGELDVMAFIEAIPFSETREYVQAVLSYRVIYQIRQGKPPELFSQAELAFKY